MTSLTIHGLDDSLASLIRAKARAEGTSMNQVIKRLLEEALGIKPSSSTHRKDFEKFCGMWSKTETAAFDRAVKAFDKIDAGDWE